MSGGVDSSVAAWRLREAGWDVTGVHFCGGADGGVDHRADARTVAGRLGIELRELDFRADLEQLIEHVADEYLRGRTPNPCVVCNPWLKFARLIDAADAIGAEAMATGHHARIVEHAGRRRIARGRDPDKDQSYVLCGLRPPTIGRLVLPVGEMTKAEVRAAARDLGLAIHDKRDSQDVCFAPDGDYAGLLRRRRPEAFVSGDVVDTTGRKLGTHEGIAGFTIGQRRGLGIAMGEPHYVAAIEPASHTVTIGPRAALLRRGLRAEAVHWQTDPPVAPFRATVQVRYRHAPAACTVEPVGPDRMRVVFDQPQFAITPGQAAVVYDGELLCGGGTISESFEP